MLNLPDERYRMPDVCFYDRSDASVPNLEAFPTAPPCAVFEVLSDTDQWGEISRKYIDYRKLGVRQTYAIDSISRDIFSVKANGEFIAVNLTEQGCLLIPLTKGQVEIRLAPLFAALA